MVCMWNFHSFDWYRWVEQLCLLLLVLNRHIWMVFWEVFLLFFLNLDHKYGKIELIVRNYHEQNVQNDMWGWVNLFVLSSSSSVLHFHGRTQSKIERRRHVCCSSNNNNRHNIGSTHVRKRNIMQTVLSIPANTHKQFTKMRYNLS